MARDAGLPVWRESKATAAWASRGGRFRSRFSLLGKVHVGVVVHRLAEADDADKGVPA